MTKKIVAIWAQDEEGVIGKVKMSYRLHLIFQESQRKKKLTGKGIKI